LNKSAGDPYKGLADHLAGLDVPQEAAKAERESQRWLTHATTLRRRIALAEVDGLARIERQADGLLPATQRCRDVGVEPEGAR
jgi:hypothetical protein